jgi:hypothetical protein
MTKTNTRGNSNITSSSFHGALGHQQNYRRKIARKEASCFRSTAKLQVRL